MTKGIVDRFEGEYALIETDQGMIQIPKTKLPAELKEGDCILIDGEQVTIDHEGTANRHDALKQRLRSLFSQ